MNKQQLIILCLTLLVSSVFTAHHRHSVKQVVDVNKDAAMSAFTRANAQRAEHGLGALTWNEEVYALAFKLAKEF